VSRQALADGSASHVLALGAPAADSLGAGVGAATGAAVRAAHISTAARAHRTLPASNERKIYVQQGRNGFIFSRVKANR